MATRAYSGSVRPISSRYENDPAYEPAENDDADGSVYRGYRHRVQTSQFVAGACMVVSPARQAALDTENATRTVSEAQIATFLASISNLAQIVKDNAGTAAQQQAAQRALLVKLSRAVLGLRSDPP